MNENHQDKTENKLRATEDNLWLPPLSPKEQKKVDQFQKKPFVERMGLKGKTLWDWLNLLAALAIPLVVVLATIGFGLWQAHLSDLQHQSDQQLAATRYANDQQLTADQQRETTLKTYLDDMSNLLLNNKLLESKPGDAVRQVARERTLTTLRRLEAKRNRIVVQFLQDTHLIGGKNAVIDLSGADLRNDDLSSANLSGANLSLASLDSANLDGANLDGANLSHAWLRDANLSHASLHGANLSHAWLRDANLSHASLHGANLSDTWLRDANLSLTLLDSANLDGANLDGANLSHAWLRDANLSHAWLHGANLSDTWLSGALLWRADLSEADMRGALLLDNNLDKTILKGARYNTKEILIRDPQGNITGKFPPTQWLSFALIPVVFPPDKKSPFV